MVNNLGYFCCCCGILEVCALMTVAELLPSGLPHVVVEAQGASTNCWLRAMWCRCVCHLNELTSACV